MPKGASTTNQQKKQAAKRKARLDSIQRAGNIKRRNTAKKEAL